MISIILYLVFSTFLAGIFSDIISPMIIPNVRMEMETVRASIKSIA